MSWSFGRRKQDVDLYGNKYVLNIKANYVDHPWHGTENARTDFKFMSLRQKWPNFEEFFSKTDREREKTF